MTLEQAPTLIILNQKTTTTTASTSSSLTTASSSLNSSSLILSMHNASTMSSCSKNVVDQAIVPISAAESSQNLEPKIISSMTNMTNIVMTSDNTDANTISASMMTKVD